MSLDIICSSKLIIAWVTLSENRSFLGTDNVWGLKNIRPHFGAKRLYCFYLSRACWLELRPRQLSCSRNLELIIQLLNMVSHGSQLSINFESFTSRQQEIVKKTEWIPNMGLIPNKIPLIKLFLHMVQYPGLPRMVLARCATCAFVEDSFMFSFVSKWRKTSNAWRMSSNLIFFWKTFNILTASHHLNPIQTHLSGVFLVFLVTDFLSFVLKVSSRLLKECLLSTSSPKSFRTWTSPVLD